MMINVHLQQRTVLGTCVFLFVLVCLTLGYVAWQWHHDWVLTKQSTESPTLAKVNDNENRIAAISAAHLFGKPAEKITTITEVPISNLQLQVTGIVKQTQGPSKVFISTGGRPSKIYRIGDSVATGVKVYDITADTIILENNGRMEKLPLLREKLEFKSRPKGGL